MINIFLTGGPLKQGEFEFESDEIPTFLSMSCPQDSIECCYILESISESGEHHYKYLGKDM